MWGIVGGNAAMLGGQYECRLDQKGRIAVPAKLRKEFDAGLVLTRGVDKCLVLYSPTEWQKVAEKHSYSPFSPSKERMLNRLMFANSYELGLDGQGRIQIPPPLREHAQITDAVVIIGQNTYAEVWSKEQWDNQKLLIDEQAWQLAEGIEKR
ncbi:MAG: division/cell wall cluster transcriptional repressor MraZ [Chloroflexi bacterium]|nr:division/cell wall cluster transcriptional repressor MraZ [Chloroflexota bacterium]